MAAEAAMEADARRHGNDPAAQIARLTHEVQQLRQLADEPGSAMTTARLAMAEAEMRIRQATALEQSVAEMIEQLATHRRETRSYADALLKKAEITVAEAEQIAQQSTVDAQREVDQIIRDARTQADSETSLATTAAADIVDRARHEATSVQAKAGPIMDSLLGSASQEAETIRQQAQAERIETEQHSARSAARKMSRAMLEIERIVRDAQRRLESAGDSTASATLDSLLLDFGIGDSLQPESQGRHSRRALPSPATEAPRALP